MAADDLLYKSIFILFTGFLTFVLIIVNKIHSFLAALDSYFVLFLFFGILMSIVGVSMVLVWQFKNRKPFEEAISIPRVKLNFPPFLAFGILLFIIGIVPVYFFRWLHKNIYFMSLAVSITGIFLLLNGLRHFMKEVMIKKESRKSLPHS